MKILDTSVCITVECEACGETYCPTFTPDGLSIDELEHQAANGSCPMCGHKEEIERDG